MTQIQEQQHHARAPEPGAAHTRPISPAACEYARAHPDPVARSAEEHELYAELGGIQ
jgi:hypothetical protein